MKLTAGVNFINIVHSIFLYKFFAKSQNLTREAAKKDFCTNNSRVWRWWNWPQMLHGVKKEEKSPQNQEIPYIQQMSVCSSSD